MKTFRLISDQTDEQVLSMNEYDFNLYLAAVSLLEMLTELLPFAENEAESLRECLKRDGIDDSLENTLAACDKWIEKAKNKISELSGLNRKHPLLWGENDHTFVDISNTGAIG